MSEPAGYHLSDPTAKSGLRERADCTVCAFVHASGLPYLQVHAVLARHGRRPRCGFVIETRIHRIARDLGLCLRMVRRSGTVARLVADFPRGTLIVQISEHAFAVIDGVIYDSYPTSTRCRVVRAWRVV